MSVLTEAALRLQLKDADLDAMTEFRVEEGVIVTPSAKAWLMDNKIGLVVGSKRIFKNPVPPIAGPKDKKAAEESFSVLPPFEKPARYESLYGGFYEEKPEHMTALIGNTLVFKDHKIIILRGKIDSLEAKILEAQLVFRRLKLEKGVADLAEVCAYVKDILRCEVLGEPMPPMGLLGMDDDEIRSRSHTPKKYYGLPHFSATVEDGEGVVALNSLRTLSREVEIAAYEAFKKENGAPERPDIIQALNRLSSVFYVMMFKVKKKEYES